MDQPDDEIIFEPSDELIERVNGRGLHPNTRREMKSTHLRRNTLHHLLQTAQGNASKTKGKVHKRPKPSLPKLPWDKPE